MSLPQIVLDVPTLKLTLCIVGGLLLIAMVRITFLLRTNNRLRESTAKMEKQVLTQYQEILAVRQDSNAWRGELQRAFDAFRAEFSNRLAESEQRYQDIQMRYENAAKPAVAKAFAPPPLPSPAPSAEPPEEKAVPPVPAIAIS
ncbi:hypothetical protein [Prosthecobacter sp.]|uniref:hypothetical protein n=1 Tax=Prosthecobacter sp. TaxID=1965333 RepID=UPI002AB9266A|nr:hypothetical protein [Prosthecobacter sp.]MDZ4401127.1 hypothetical protein [Prosthecobacter sp.]